VCGGNRPFSSAYTLNFTQHVTSDFRLESTKQNNEEVEVEVMLKYGSEFVIAEKIFHL
jgi:hypothetical protein